MSKLDNKLELSPTIQQSANHQGAAGGSASSGGAQFAASVAAWCAVKMLLGKGAAIPWSTVSDTSISLLSCENPTEVDDLVLKLLPKGTVYIQIKHGLQIGSEFRKAMGQLVRQFQTQDFSVIHDRLVIATDYTASRTIRNDMSIVLKRCRDLPATELLDNCITSKATKTAFHRLKETFDTEWMATADKPAMESEFRSFLNCTHITILDPLSDVESANCIEHLNQVISEEKSKVAWCLINQICLDSAVIRKPLDRPCLWTFLDRDGIQSSVRKLHVDERSISITDVMRQMTSDVLSDQMRLGWYKEELIVQRRTLNKYFAKFQDSTAKLFIVSGDSGQGKSIWSLSTSSKYTESPLLLIRGESLDPSDKGVLDTVRRLLRNYVTQIGSVLPQEYELNEWLDHAALLVIIDGLDRASGEFTRRLKYWFEGTLTDLLKANVKAVITTRPETLTGASNLLNQHSLVFQTEKEREQFRLSKYDNAEAEEAAMRLNTPWLAKYRHPQMMAFCSKLSERDTTILPHHEITRRYLECRLDEIQFESGVLREQLEWYVDAVANALAQSSDGMPKHSSLCNTGVPYEALRRANFLTVIGNTIRVEPDEISEYLQGRHTDIPASICRLADNLQQPLKIGALRSAIVQSSIRSPQQAVANLEQVIYFLEKNLEDVIFSLVCSIIDELLAGDDIYSLLLRVAKAWNRSNLYTWHGAGNDLLEIIMDKRWIVSQRLELLWAMGKCEEGLDWRTKHWLTPEYASNYFVTPWRIAMLSTLEEADQLGLVFLLPYLDSRTPLIGSDEADMGHLAQGLFYLSCKMCVSESMNLLVSYGTESSFKLSRNIAQKHPVQIAHWLPVAVAEQRLPDKLIAELLQIVSENSSALQVVCEFTRKLLRHCPKESFLYYVCLQTLSKSSDSHATTELLEHSNLTIEDTSTCAGYEGQEFDLFVTRILERVALGEVDPSVLEGFAIETNSECQAATLEKLLAKWIGVDRSRAEFAAPLVELLIHRGIWLDAIPQGLLNLIDQMISIKSSIANRCLVYSCTGHASNTELPKAGRCFRTMIIERLVMYETDQANLLLLAKNLISRPGHSAHAGIFLRKLQIAHPSINFLEHLKAWDFLPGVEVVLAEVFTSDEKT